MTSTSSSSNQLPAKPAYRRQAEIVLGGIAAMYVIYILLDLIEANYNPINQMISEHLHGPYRWVMFFGFLGLAVAHWVLSIALKTGFNGQIKYKAGAIFLKISAIGFLLAGSFSDSFDLLLGNTKIESGFVHLLASMLAFLMLFISQLIITFQFWKAGRLHGLYRLLPWLAVLSIIFFLIPFEGPVGLVQRLYLIIPLGWTVLVATGIRSEAFRVQ